LFNLNFFAPAKIHIHVLMFSRSRSRLSIVMIPSSCYTE
jgi:hypothetical protein